MLIWAVRSAKAGPLFDTSTPISFFTNVASRLLASQLKVNLSHIEIYPTNQYTPAVHRLLQVTANIWDAQNTNFYPTVFRPLFAADGSNDLYICGYQQVAGVSGPADPQLAMPYDPATLASYAGTNPVSDTNGPVNVYGVPWVLGVKQGLPGFNQLSLVTVGQASRNLEVLRNSLNPATAVYATNQMYMIGITNNLGVSFWNPYQAAYPRSLNLVVSDVLSTVLTNGFYTWSASTSLSTNITIDSWPGSQWSGIPPNSALKTNGFVSMGWPLVFLNPMAYDLYGHTFDVNPRWNPVQAGQGQLDQLGLTVTNCLQAYILDGTNVIDYVQFLSPVVAGSLNSAIADPNYPQPGNVYYQWSTNSAPQYGGTPFGLINQLWVSSHGPYNAPAGGQWGTAPTPMGLITPSAEAAYFAGFFTPTFQYMGLTYVNHQLLMEAPYTPIRTVYSAVLLQANDPLVHYLASDLNGQAGVWAAWGGKRYYQNGVWQYTDIPELQSMPTPPSSPVGGRYQPWGRFGQLSAYVGIDTNVYQLAYKDPLVWGADYWSFPTGQDWSLSWLGQVHRGTPWQTIYLKSTNELDCAQPLLNSGANTWAAWTGDLQQDPASGQYLDAASSAPVTDWQLVDLLVAMLNTNDLRSRFSVNNSDPSAWAVELDGLTALTNVSFSVISNMIVPVLQPVTISSNSPQASLIADAIQSIRAGLPSLVFRGIGDMLATPELSVQSPYLGSNAPANLAFRYGISDQAYEAIPSQLLPLLRADSIGNIVSTNSGTMLQFSGYDGHTYVVQVTQDFLSWTSVSTNSPDGGVFGVSIPAVTNGGAQFYRTVLVQ